MRIAFFGDGAWAALSLERLVQDGHEIIRVVERIRPTDSSLTDEAGRRMIPVSRPRRVNSCEFVRRLVSWKPDISVSVSYDQVLRRPIIRSARLGFLNFHGGMLPKYRGRNVINWAIINNEREIGLTGHFVDEGVDTGDIVLQRSIPVDWTDTYGDVLRKVTAAMPALVSETVRLVSEGNPERRVQSDIPGTYFSQRGEGDEWFNWSDTSLNIYNKIRAIARPGPGARTLLNGRVVLVWRASYDMAWPKYIGTPGQVVGRVCGEGVIVKTGDSTILLREIQIEDGEPEVPCWRIGTRLGVDHHSVLRGLGARVPRCEGGVGKHSPA